MNTLDDLLSVWEERKESGDPITPEELCRNCPEMLEKVRWHIRALNQVDSQFGVTPAGLINSSTGVGDHTLSVHDRKFEVVSISNQYVIERHHASGGLGDVFLASDSCLKRRVAIKFPRASRMSDEQLARFEREARVTSRLDHPGIVSVHSLKQDTPSQLCYVMRFVEGPTLYERAVEIHAKSADSKSSNRYSSMEFRQLLNHYAALCKIVAYAHGQGVIHRDIKPNNVILGPFGETLLMDWGLARIDGDDELEELAGPSDNAQPNAIETKSGQILGTPAYASPEQLLGKKGQVDPRSDIFSLGATLHFLLTGKSPADAKNMHEHMERIKRQATTLAILGSEIPRPLVAICKCAAHPVQTQRYQSAIALADDIERYLANEQVSVLPDSLTTRSLRWMRKHPTATVASTLSMLLLLMFSVLGITVLSDFNRRLSTSNTSLERANDSLARANISEKASRELADVNFQSAKDAVEQFLVKVTEDPRVKSADFTDLRKDLLGSAQPFFEKLRDQKPGDAQVEASRAEAFFRIAFIQEATGQEELAKANYEQCASIYLRLSTEEPANAAYRISLAKTHRNLGLLLEKLDKYEDAKLQLLQAIAIRERLNGEFPEEAAHRIDQVDGYLGIMSALRALGELDEAKEQGAVATEISEDLVASFPEDPECRNALAKSLSAVGMLLNQLEDREPAKEFLEKCISIRGGIVRDCPDDTQYQIYLAKSHHNLGFVLADMGERENAVAQYEIALTMNANLAADFPTVTGYQTDIVSLHQNIGNLQMRMGKRTEALQHLETAASVLEQLTRAYPAVPTHAVSLGSCYCNLGNFWMSSDQPAALQWFTKSEAVLKPVWEKEPRDTKVRSFLRNVYGGRASVLNMLNRFSEAADDWKLASELDEGRNKAFFDQQAIQSAALAEQAKIFERILGGESIELDDADQRAAFALYCHNQKNYLKAAQQYQLALQDKPELAAANRYNAVCSASLALADNQSELLTAEQKTAWRAQALVWLQAELETLADKTPRNRATLRHWLQDSDIAALRDTASLVELPESEREQWTTLWQSVREAVE